MGVYFGKKKICSLFSDYALKEPGSSMNRKLKDLVDKYRNGHDVGECRMVVNTKIGNVVDYSQFKKNDSGVYELNVGKDSYFDGWVLANGDMFLKKDFPIAFETYKTGDTDDFFRVPSVENFFRLNPGETKDNPIEHVEYRHQTYHHRHEILGSGTVDEMDFNNGLSVVLSKKHSDTTAVQEVDGQILPILCPGYNNGRDYNDFSKSNPPEKMSPYSIDLNIPYSVIYGKTTDHAGTEESTEAYPAYNKVFCVVYIGSVRT